MSRKRNRLLNSIVCMLLALTVLFTSIDFSFAAGEAHNPIPKIKYSGKGKNNYSLAEVSNQFYGRKLVGAGWVFGIAKYNTAEEHGYTALGVEELYNVYKNGLLVYNDNVSVTCAAGHTSLVSELAGGSGHGSVKLANNALVSSGYYHENLEFTVNHYTISSSSNHGSGNVIPTSTANNGFFIQEVTNDDNSMCAINFTHNVGSSSDGKLYISETNEGSRKVPLSGVYPVDVSGQVGLVLTQGRLRLSRTSSKSHYNSTCSTSNPCGNDSYAQATKTGTNGDVLYGYYIGTTEYWHKTGGVAVGSEIVSGKTVSGWIWSGGCNCSSTSFCTNCDYWESTVEASVTYDAYKGTIAEAARLAEAAEGSTTSLYTDLKSYPTDTINIINGVAGLNRDSLDNISYGNSDFTGSWLYVAKELLGDATSVSKIYNEGTYVLESDFPELNGKTVNKYWRNNNRGISFFTLDSLLQGTFNFSPTPTDGSRITPQCLSDDNGVVKSEVTKSDVSYLDESSATNAAKIGAKSSLSSNPKCTAINTATGSWYTDDDTNGFKTVFSCYIPFKIGDGTKPIGVAGSFMQTSGGSQLQYNAYSTGGLVSVKDGNKSNFDNGLFNDAGDNGSCTKCAAVTKPSAVSGVNNSQVLHKWYGGRVGAFTDEPTGIKEFSKIIPGSSFRSVINDTIYITPTKDATEVANTVGKDITKYNSLWSVIDGKPANKDTDLNDGRYRSSLYNALTTLKGSNFTTTVNGSTVEITNDAFTNNEVQGLGEEWIYVIVAVPVILIENYISGASMSDGTSSEVCLDNNRGQKVIAAYPSCEFLEYDGSLNNTNASSVGSMLLGTESYAVGGYLGCFAGIAGMYSIGHKQYMSNELGGATWEVTIGSGIIGTINDRDYTASGVSSEDADESYNNSSVTYNLARKIYRDADMDFIKDNDVCEQPDFRGFAVYGANLDMSVRLTSNVAAYLDSTSFDATLDGSDDEPYKGYADVDFANLGLRNYNLNLDEDENGLVMDNYPYNVALNFGYESRGVRYWYSSNCMNPDKKLFRTSVTRNIATPEVTGINADYSYNEATNTVTGSRKSTEYSDYDILNESSQFYVKSTTGTKIPIYKKDDESGNYLHNVIQNANSRTKVKYNGKDVSGDVAFGSVYTTEVIYDSANNSNTLTGALSNKIDSMRVGNANFWDSPTPNTVIYKKDANTNLNGVVRYFDRDKDRANYDPIKVRSMVFAGKMMLNGMEFTDPVDSQNRAKSYPGRFILSGSEENGYYATGNGQYATVSVQVYEKRKTNKSHLRVIDIEVDEDGNFVSASKNGSMVHSKDAYYYDEESYLDWTKPNSGIQLMTDRTDAEIAVTNPEATGIVYMAVPNSSNYGCDSDGKAKFKADAINENNYKISQLKGVLGATDTNVSKGITETGVNVGTTPKNDGYTVYVFRYFVKFGDGTTGEDDGSITADTSLYLEDYELSHVYNNMYNRKDADASTIEDYYLRTSYTYKYDKESNPSISHTWIKTYGTNGAAEFKISDKYKKVVSNYTRYIWQNKLHKDAVDSIVGKYSRGTAQDTEHNYGFYTVGTTGYFSTIMGSNKFDFSYPQSSLLAIPFYSTLTRVQDKKLGYAVMLTRDMAGDKVTISGLTNSTVMNQSTTDITNTNTSVYNDAMRDAFISYLTESGVIELGKDKGDVPQNTDAIKLSDLDDSSRGQSSHRTSGADTIAKAGSKHGGFNTTSQSIRHGSDITSETITASQDTTSLSYYSVKDRISLTGGWQDNKDKYKEAQRYDDKAINTVNATPITDATYKASNGVGQSNVLKHEFEDAHSELRTLMILKDRNGDRVHGFVGNIDVYQYFYKYYVGARPIGYNTDRVLGGSNRQNAPDSNNYLLEAEDYLTSYPVNNKHGKLPTVSSNSVGSVSDKSAYTQVYLKTNDIVVSYFPEVIMSMQVPALESIEVDGYGVPNEMRTQVNKIFADTVWTLGEYIRRTELSSLYFVSIKSSGGKDTINELYSDNSTSNSKGSVFGNTIPSLYSGADVSLVVKPQFSIWTYGYSLDLINKKFDGVDANNNPVNNIVDESGTLGYTSVVNDNVDIYTTWGNDQEDSTNGKAYSRDILVKDFTDFTKAVGLSLEADISLKSVDSIAYSSDTVKADKAEVYQNFSTSVGKLTSGDVNDNNLELIYNLEVRHGVLCDTSSFRAMIKQMAVDYYGIEDITVAGNLVKATSRVTNTQFDTMKALFMDSGMVETILDSIESDTDADNTSNVIGHKILGVDNKAHWSGIQNNRWYDERVKTFVVRRFYQKSVLDSVVLDDKLDYSMGKSSDLMFGGNDNTQTSYDERTYSWFLNLYMDSNLIVDTSGITGMDTYQKYFRNDKVYNSQDSPIPNTNWYSPTRDDNTYAYKAGTGLIHNLYLPDADFNIVSDAVAN